MTSGTDPNDEEIARSDIEQSDIARIEAELRRRQIRGLLLLAAIILAATLWGARHGLFPPGWWRIW